MVFFDPLDHSAAAAVDLARAAVRVLGLDVAGVDIVVGPDGGLSIIEVNPEPDITRDGDAYRLEFPDAIAAYLVDRASRGVRR